MRPGCDQYAFTVQPYLRPAPSCKNFPTVLQQERNHWATKFEIEFVTGYKWFATGFANATPVANLETELNGDLKLLHLGLDFIPMQILSATLSTPTRSQIRSQSISSATWFSVADDQFSNRVHWRSILIVQFIAAVCSCSPKRGL